MKQATRDDCGVCGDCGLYDWVCALGSANGVAAGVGAILRLLEFTIPNLQGVVSRQVLVEAERNIKKKLPRGMKRDQQIVANIRLEVEAHPSREDILSCAKLISLKDAPISAAAILLDPKRRSALGELDVGEAVVRLQSRWFRPFSVRFPKAPVEGGEVDDEQVKVRMGGDSTLFSSISPPGPMKRGISASSRERKDGGLTVPEAVWHETSIVVIFLDIVQFIFYTLQPVDFRSFQGSTGHLCVGEEGAGMYNPFTINVTIAREVRRLGPYSSGDLPEDRS